MLAGAHEPLERKRPPVFCAVVFEMLLDKFDTGVVEDIGVIVVAVDAVEGGEGAHVVAEHGVC